MTDLTDPIARLMVTPARRMFVAFVQGGLGVLLLVSAAGLSEPSPAAIFALVAFGLLALWQAARSYRAAGLAILLTREGLYDSSGRLIAALSDIASVDRGFFAFKPSNGFLLRLKARGERAWVPGLWWRLGTRVGIGGATSGRAARDMADVISILLADPEAGLWRDGEENGE